ncbi:hypothetical protein QBC42DRAFT_290744 [Cladorrhinum samala]|uniref:Uncharacterized protein n=1 Tax=Cladorrhinum samala TaxID=585594 RepID=A0AAV9HC87_9PEZI|nr:hypothetical protein QBC42DRAFT_290744 [Cladorrhinum samala]
MAPGRETSSSVDATSCDPQSAASDIHSAQPQLDTFPVNDAASHLYDDGAFQLYQTTAAFGMLADYTALLADQPAPLPAIDEGEALDPMLIVDNGEPLRNPLLSATIYDNTSFGMTRNDGHDLLHDSPLPAIVYGNASFDMMSIDDLNPLHDQPATMHDNASSDMVSIDNGSLFAGPPLQLPELSDAMHFASKIIQNQSFQLPGENTSALRIPPCTGISANSFNLNPSPPLFADTSLWDQAPLTGPFDIGLSAPLATFGTWDNTLQIPAAQSSGVSPGVLAHSFPITNSSADAGSGLSQPSRQEELGTPHLASNPRKRALDDTQSSPMPSSKRLATIRPKSLPAQMRSTGDSSPKPDAKLAHIPLDMVTTWRADTSGLNNSSKKRTRVMAKSLVSAAATQASDVNYTSIYLV